MHEPLQSDVQTLSDLPAGSCLLKKYEELHLFAVFQDFLFAFILIGMIVIRDLAYLRILTWLSLMCQIENIILKKTTCFKHLKDMVTKMDAFL